jgi:acyl carrier protein
MSNVENYRDIALRGLIENPLIFLNEDQISSLKNPSCDLLFSSINLDSLAKMELIIWLEIEIGLALTNFDFSEIKSLWDLEKRIEKHLNETLNS